MDERSKILDVLHIEVNGEVYEGDVYIPFSGNTERQVQRRSRAAAFKTTYAENTWCWWCCHPFESSPLALPVRYDEKRDVFTLMGVFCSWGCVKAYNTDTQGYRSGRIADNITLLHRRTEGHVKPLRASPPRQMLAVFGGSLGIESFRNVPANTTYKMLPPNVVYQTPNIVVHESSSSSKKKKKESTVDFEGSVAKDVESLRLRRTKPTTNHKNTLDRMPGFTFSKKK